MNLGAFWFLTHTGCGKPASVARADDESPDLRLDSTDATPYSVECEE
jgi:hypothetical protein